MVKNEEKHIRNVICAIQGQDQKPTRVLVVNHGSTDKTGEILDSMSGIEVTHYKSNTSKHLPNEFFEIQDSLFKKASAGVDYVMCIDGDTIISNSYVSSIVKRMQQDKTVIACGQDPNNKVTLVVESPSIMDAKWLGKFNDPARTSRMNSSILLVHASLTGFRAAVYTDILLHYERSIDANSGSRIVENRGNHLRQNGFSLWYVALMAFKRRNLHYVKGYISSKKISSDSKMTAWWNRYQYEKVFGRFIKKRILRNTDTAIYVEPYVPVH